MDDLLIVRASDRVRVRSSQRRTRAPMGANIGLIMGVGFGALGASQFESNPVVGIALGLAVGLAIGGILGSLLKPRSQRRSTYPKNHYTGFPPTDVEEDEPEEA